jgi:hypothetical protein
MRAPPRTRTHIDIDVDIAHWHTLCHRDGNNGTPHAPTRDATSPALWLCAPHHGTPHIERIHADYSCKFYNLNLTASRPASPRVTTPNVYLLPSLIALYAPPRLGAISPHFVAGAAARGMT